MKAAYLRRACSVLLSVVLLGSCAAHSQSPRFKVLAFYSTSVEKDHVLFAEDAIKFYAAGATQDGFAFVATSDWDDLNPEKLKDVQVVLWLNDQPHSETQRVAFENYMTHGGGWLGFHVAAYNDEETKWPWFVQFLGGGVFYGNNWPPLPALLNVDDKTSVITKRLPPQFTSPPNEWYIWRPSPRLNKSVKVLVTLDASNYPIGLKDTIKGGDLPVVWTNINYKMIYMNMGHGDKIFKSTVQNKLFEDALLWLGDRR